MKRKTKFSATQYSLRKLRQLGYTCGVVERWNPHARIKQDLFGFIDLVAMQPEMPLLAIQATTSDHQAERVDKIKQEPRALTWLQAGGRIFVHGWSRRKIVRGGKAVRYEVNEIEITTQDF